MQIRPHILIFGAGAVGGYMGGRLIQGMHHAIRDDSAAPPAHIALLGRARMKTVLQSSGLRLTHYNAPPVQIPPSQIDVFDDIAACPAPDVICLCVKSQDTQLAAEQIKQTGWDVPIISWQNGVGNVDVLRRVLPDSEVIPAMVPFNITSPQPGQFHCGTGGALHMGRSDHPHVKRFRAMMEAAGEPVMAVQDIENYQWGKLVINLNNALNTLMGGSLRAGFMDRHYRHALALSWEEALGIVTTSGAAPKFFNGMEPQKFMGLLRWPTFIFAPIFSRIIKMDAAARSSMLDDLEAGKQSEIDFLQGAIIKLAAKNGQTASINEALYGAVRAAFEAGESPKLAGREVWGVVEEG